MKLLTLKGFVITETVYNQDGSIYSVDILCCGKLKDYKELLDYIDTMQGNYSSAYAIKETENGFTCFDKYLGYTAVEVEVTENDYLEY